MRRTGNTSAWPAIGILIAGTLKIGFGPDCACAEPPCVAAPANARAPVARMLLLSTVSISVLHLIFPETCLAPPFAPGKKIKRLRRGIKKARDDAGLLVWRVAYHFTSAGSLPPLAA